MPELPDIEVYLDALRERVEGCELLGVRLGSPFLLRSVDPPIADIAGRHILLVDDVLESGRTLAFARDTLLRRGAAEVRTCLLLDKRGARKVAIEADFVGFPIGREFVVGYGLDLAHRYRGLPFIGRVRGG